MSDANEAARLDREAYLRGLERDDELATLRAEVERLRAALYGIMELDGEINPMNYDADDVSKLNNAFIETFHIARAALGQEKKNDLPQPLGGWAAGYYWHKACSRCGKEFEGDKRAWHCEPCSMTMVTKEPPNDR